MRKDLTDFKLWLIEKELSASTVKSYVFSMTKFFSEYPEMTKANALMWKRQLMDITDDDDVQSSHRKYLT